MEAEVLYAKMESLNRCIDRIQSKTPETLEELMDDLDGQDIIVLNLERAVQQSVDMGLHILVDYNGSNAASMADVFLELEKNKVIEKKLAEKLIKAVGFRNIAVHEYRSLDWKILWSVIQHHLNDFKEFNRAVLALIS